jgi:hypothetical protein
MMEWTIESDGRTRLPHALLLAAVLIAVPLVGCAGDDPGNR